MGNGWKPTTYDGTEAWHPNREHQRRTVAIYGSSLIRALNEKLNVQVIMADRTAAECTVIV